MGDGLQSLVMMLRNFGVRSASFNHDGSIHTIEFFPAATAAPDYEFPNEPAFDPFMAAAHELVGKKHERTG